jgi:hypothetical protein
MVCRKQDSGFYDLGLGHCGGSNFVKFDFNIHIYGRVCSETNMRYSQTSLRETDNNRRLAYL